MTIKNTAPHSSVAVSTAHDTDYAALCQEQLPLALIVVDACGQIVHANPAAEAALGSTLRLLHGQPAHAFFIWPDEMEKQWLSLCTQPKRVADVIAQLKPRGSEKTHTIHVHAAPLEITDQQAQLMLYFEAESQRIPTPDPSYQRTASLANVLAHEIKNPLTGIRGAAQLLAKSVPETAQKFTQLIIAEVERIRRLVDEMVTFSESAMPVFAAVNMHEILRHGITLLQANGATAIHVKESFDPSLPEVRGQHDRLIQLVLNLLLNAQEALKHTPQPTISLRSFYRHSPRIHASGSHHDVPNLVFQIEDNGGGIPPELQPQILEPFISSKPGSRGLGLAIAAKIAAEHHGTLRLIESRPGHTLFEICLPRWK